MKTRECKKGKKATIKQAAGENNKAPTKTKRKESSKKRGKENKRDSKQHNLQSPPCGLPLVPWADRPPPGLTARQSSINMG